MLLAASLTARVNAGVTVIDTPAELAPPFPSTTV
jgi:hypothetical protein